MASLLDRSISTTGANSPQFQPSSASSSFFGELSRSMERTSIDMQNKSDNIYINSFLTDARKGARDIYNKNAADPDQLTKELVKYKDGLQSNMPSNLKPRLDQEFSGISEKYLDKATTTKNSILTSEQTVAQENNENQIISDIQFAARDLFAAPKGLSEDEIKTRNGTSLNQIISDFDAIDKNLNQVGADGKPLKTPEQKIKSVVKAKEFLFTEAANSWLDSQDDKLTAYHKWLNNEVTLDLPEGSINIRDTMTPEVRQKVDKQLIQSIKDDLYISKQRQEEVDKMEKEFAENTKKALFDKSKTGNLNPKDVERSRNILDYNDYKDFVKMSRSADPISNGTIYGQLVDQIDQGQDVGEEIRKARFTDKALSNDDFERLIDKNSQRGSKGPIPDSVAEGRDYLLGYLGSNSKLLDITNSAVMAKAEREYNGRIQDFIDANKRKPNRSESMAISDEVSERYNVLQMNEVTATLPKPKAMPLEMKVKRSELTIENVQKVKEDTVKMFMEKHGGDVEKMKEDPAFVEEIKIINQYNIVATKRANKVSTTTKKGGF
jgi:hypothetical protein